MTSEFVNKLSEEAKRFSEECGMGVLNSIFKDVFEIAAIFHKDKIWHTNKELPIDDVEVICINYNDKIYNAKLSECDCDEVKKWAYIEDII